MTANTRTDSTKSRKADADLYRAAAKLMEDGTFGMLTQDSCCWAIGLVKDPTRDHIESEKDPHGKRMKAVFAPDTDDGGYWLHDEAYLHTAPEQTPHRILALCFMAAMVEAGDA